MEFDVARGVLSQPIEVLFAWALCLTSFPYAIIKGRWVERIVAIGFVAGLFAVHQIYVATETNVHRLNALVIADVCMFAFILPFALFSDRYWPMWMLGVWTMMILIDFVLLIQPKPSFAAFANSSAFWTDASLLILLIGTWWEGSRRPPTRIRLFDAQTNAG
jgi:hypothetical protein